MSRWRVTGRTPAHSSGVVDDAGEEDLGPAVDRRGWRGFPRLAAPGVIVGLMVVGCGGSPAAIVRTAPAETGHETAEVGDDVGAHLDPSADGVGFDETELSEVSVSDNPLADASSGAVAAAEALLEGFIDAVALNNLERAATLTTGEAKSLLFYLTEAQRCGFTVASAEFGSVSNSAELAGVGQLAMPASASITLDNGLTRTINALAVRREAEGVWLISDLLIDGHNADDLSVDLDSTVRADLRLTPIEQCAGADTVQARFEVFNEGRDPVIVKEFYYLDNAGNRYRVDGSDPTVAPIPGRSTDPLIWEFTVDVTNGYDGGQFVVVAADLDESRQEDTEVLVTREYPVFPSPFFSDFDVNAAAIAKALGEVVTTTSQAPDTTAASGSGGGTAGTTAPPPTQTTAATTATTAPPSTETTPTTDSTATNETTSTP